MDETVRIAAAADLHCAEPLRERTVRAFKGVQADADLILLAGDLTTHGEPEQALVLADACRNLSVPVVAVLGNHDHHADRCDELTATLAISSAVLIPEGEPGDLAKQQFERIVEGLARQLRSPLDRKLGRYAVTLPVFPNA